MIVEKLSTIHMNSQKRRKSSKKKKKTIIVTIKILDINKLGGRKADSGLYGQTLSRETLFWNYPHYHKGSGMTPAATFRKGNYKLIEWYESSLLTDD
ncbi:MAG: hypothetical protein KAQ62_21360 [Cyclobacteriaceae bacterium]|nr:hypothetical protein [Cyclobacteriaceae bacterium]